MWKFHLAVVVAALCISGTVAVISNLQVKFAPRGGFYEIPLSKEDVEKDSSPEYVYADHDEDLNVDLYSYPEDPRFFILFASNGNIAGLRLGYIKEDVAKRAKSNNLTFPYNFYEQPFYTSGNYWNTPLWYTTVLFLDPETLRSGNGPSPTDSDVDLYLPFEGKWTLIPKDQCKAEDLGFVKQACYNGMGMHYFHKLNTTSNCEDITTVFTLYEYEKLIGFGFSPFGAFTYKERNWFEDPPEPMIKAIIPYAPACLIDWTKKYGVSSLHIYFKRWPKQTICTWPWQKNDQCTK